MKNLTEFARCFSVAVGKLRVVFCGVNANPKVRLLSGKRISKSELEEIAQYKKTHSVKDTAEKYGVMTQTVLECALKEVARVADSSADAVIRCERVIADSAGKHFTVAFVTEGKDSVLYVAMQILKSNQLRIDVMNNDN